MSATDYMDAGIEALAEALGETVTYLPSGGASRNITGVFVRRRRRQESEPMHRLSVERASITVARDATTGVSVVTMGRDRFTISSETWTVVGVESESGAHFTLGLEKTVTDAVRRDGNVRERL